MRQALSVKQPTQSGRSLQSPEGNSQELPTPVDGSVQKRPASDRGSEFVAGRGSVDTLPDSRRSGGRATPGTPCLRHRTSTPRGDPTSSRPSVCRSDSGPAPSLFLQDRMHRRCREGGSREWSPSQAVVDSATAVREGRCAQSTIASRSPSVQRHIDRGVPFGPETAARIVGRFPARLLAPLGLRCQRLQP